MTLSVTLRCERHKRVTRVFNMLWREPRRATVPAVAARVYFNCIETDSSLIFCLNMIFSENRFPLFGIMPSSFEGGFAAASG